MSNNAIKLLSGLGIFVLFNFAQAGSAITAIELANGDGEQQILQVTFDGPAIKPNSFAMANPPRIAFDFSNGEIKLAKDKLELGGALLKSVIAVEGNGRARLVLNLNRNASYSSSLSGNKLLLTLDPDLRNAASVTPLEKNTITQVNTSQGTNNNSSLALDFRRGKNAEGRIEFALPSANTPVNIRREGRQLLIDVLGSRLDRQNERRLDVSDFGTPVSKIDARNQGRNSQIQVQTEGDWDYSSYQTDGRLVVEVRRPALDSRNSNDSNQKPQYKGDRLSLNFQNIEIRTILQVIAEFTGLNIVTSDSVNGNITLRLKDVPWDQALDLILQTKGLDQRRNGNIIQIAPREELLARDKQVQESRQQLATLEYLRSETFVLRYRSAEEFQKILDGSNTTGKKESLLSERGSILTDPKTNTLIVNDISASIEKIRDIIRKTDIPVKQVLIEARIVEATDNWSRDLGVKLSFDRVGSTGILSGGGLNNTISNANGRLGIAQGAPQSPYIISPGVNLPISNPAGSLTALYSVGKSAIIGLELQALQIESQGRVISSPRIMTADRQEATIEQGTEIPYQEASSSGATSTSFKKAVLSLIVKPQITPDNQVMLDIKINKDSVSPTLTVGGTPALDTKRVNTQVLVENGGTVVIGGIYQQQINDTTNKVPFLGDIPILGYLFRSSQKANNRTELLVFITPKVVEDLSGEVR
ncbi:type IV pilus secretin PilQ [Neisseriaceae bacterium TC5R-5]|nr:type IV pilus secretin PilQ [Neisseriaceae bacterium TC5R-5]